VGGAGEGGKLFQKHTQACTQLTNESCAMEVRVSDSAWCNPTHLSGRCIAERFTSLLRCRICSAQKTNPSDNEQTANMALNSMEYHSSLEVFWTLSSHCPARFRCRGSRVWSLVLGGSCNCITRGWAPCQGYSGITNFTDLHNRVLPYISDFDKQAVLGERKHGN
jgi:hypothetical protein